MRLMVFSDIHGNLEALKSIVADSAERNVDRRICLGDLVGYGPRPNECIEMVRNLKNCRCIAGNHDVACLWKTSPYGMSSMAKKAILWTMDRLKEDNKQYINELPDRFDFADMTFVHANPYNPKGWRYVMDRKYALRSFSATGSRFIFIGHSHQPLVIEKNRFIAVDLHTVSGNTEVDLAANRRRIINCGSVGQPRDKDPRSCYLIYDTRGQQLEFYRILYDIEKTIEAIRSTELPRKLGERLLTGI